MKKQRKHRDSPSVSILIAAFNAAKFIGETLESVRLEDFNYEVIVVDDHSTDDTEGIVRSFSDSRIHYFKQKTGIRGPSAARNLGAKRARSDYLYILDSDDLICTGALERKYKEIRRENDFGICLGNVVFMTEEGVLTPNATSNMFMRRMSLAEQLSHIANRFVMPDNQPLFSKRAFESVSGYREELRIAEDLDLVLRILLEKWKPSFVDGITGFYRVRSSSLFRTEGKPIHIGSERPWISLNKEAIKTKFLKESHIPCLRGRFDFDRNRPLEVSVKAFDSNYEVKLRLNELIVLVLQRIDGHRSIRTIVDELEDAKLDLDSMMEILLFLFCRGLIDFHEP